ncbi:cyclin-dependent kinase 2-associated protein 1 [Lingula anatina]|uniref:Cyclin-dependent kinase 2-associated protein 1 n=1 Tax=Lingula anatina TaxID=7574 RepID=A0A2R2MU13_LINAN|nr:cyclin-dependent kinase 2-associated protein 1 [Lingula anatina]|eukprot:XP_023933633.1 cyclin-dependent kinase 2-associated protein 1 [Lingula anatina]
MQQQQQQQQSQAQVQQPQQQQHHHHHQQHHQKSSSGHHHHHHHHQPPRSKYAQLLAVIEDMGKDIRPTYSGSKSSAERLKRGIVHARILVRECLMECERSART